MENSTEDKRLLLKFARVISDIFIPPVNLLLLFTYLAIYVEETNFTSFMVFDSALLFGVIFPIAYFVYLRKKGKIADNDASVRTQRTKPYLVGSALALVGFLMLYYYDAQPICIAAWFIYFMNTLIIASINSFWKISAHAMGVAGPLAIMTYLLGIWVIPLFVILVVVGWARVLLKIHTPAQVIAGSIVGFTITYAMLRILLNILG